MLDSLFTHMALMFAAVPFSAATWFVLATLGFFVWLFAKASQDPKSPVSWEDLIVSSDTRKASPYKLGYLVGVIVGTWIVISFADAVGPTPGTSKLTFDIFAAYLTFLVGGVVTTAVKKTTPAPVAPGPDPEDDPK
jgi:hypothetical protein